MDTSKNGRILCAAALMLVMILVASCGGSESGGAQQTSSGEGSGGDASGSASGGTAAEAGGESGEQTAAGETTARAAASDEAAELARAEVGQNEIQNMLPADGKQPDPARPLPEDPPEGIEVYPATSNATTEEPLDYPRTPPTNGDHDTLWQNCGFYEKPIMDRHAVHSMDHGVVWITHSPDLPAEQVRTLRSYGKEEYVIVSPYPGQDAPVIATSWRVQLELDGAEDPRLREFVDGFRSSELAPLSGNRCTLGVGNPQA